MMRRLRAAALVCSSVSPCETLQALNDVAETAPMPCKKRRRLIGKQSVNEGHAPQSVSGGLAVGERTHLIGKQSVRAGVS